MKKMLCVLFVFLLLVFSGCDGNKPVEEPTTEAVFNGGESIRFDMLVDPYVVNSGNYFTVYKTSSEDMQQQYYWYRIVDKNENILLEGGSEWKEPQFHEEGDIISVSLSGGTLADYRRFCNASTGEVSEGFWNIRAQNYDVACCFDPHKNKLIIFNVFDNAENIAEIEADFYSGAAPVFDAEFISDHEIRFSYYNTDNKEKTLSVNF